MGRKPSKRIKKRTSYDIPSAILKDRVVSGQEAILEFLKEKKGLTYREIGVLLNRDERNIRNVYLNAKEKRKKK